MPGSSAPPKAPRQPGRRSSSPARRVDLSTFARSHQELLRQVEETRESLLVTRRGRPMVEIVPAPLDDDQLRTRLRGQVKSMGDVVSPIDEEWDAS